ncbi:MAG: peptidoglycan editing factor PgeF [Gammaproteobacteria bacterium]|jgi:YfiH family protein|nr:peptidoglycan editing factor PgeF [Gammaproteobacteria bacterium]
MTQPLPAWQQADWQDVANVTAGFTTRTPGAVAGAAADYGDSNLALHVGDDAESVRRNRSRLIESAGLPAAPRWLEQVHGIAVLHADSISGGEQGDAAWTATPGVVCAVLTADCLPVVFAERRGRMVAVAHAGWRGLAAGVLEAALQPFRAAGISATDIRAWLGPAISAAVYEIDAPVRNAVLQSTPGGVACFKPGRPGHWYCDLYALARVRLRAAGVATVSGGEHCTFRDGRFYSYRRSPRCGRQATFAFIQET